MSNPTPIEAEVIPPRRFIDLQLSLQAVVSGAVATGSFMVWMGWQAAQQTSNMAQLQQAITKVEKRLDSRDQYQDGLRDTVYELRRATDMNTLRIGELERSRK
jgi:septal ring factor EnvC (AmiA/AmiB activator)